MDNYDAADDGDRLRGDVRLSRPRRQESVHLLLVASRFTQEEYVRRWCSGGCLLLAKSSPNHTPFPPYSRWCAETETTFTCLPATLAVVLKRLYSLTLKKNYNFKNKSFGARFGGGRHRRYSTLCLGTSLHLATYTESPKNNRGRKWFCRLSKLLTQIKQCLCNVVCKSAVINKRVVRTDFRSL